MYTNLKELQSIFCNDELPIKNTIIALYLQLSSMEFTYSKTILNSFHWQSNLKGGVVHENNLDWFPYN